MSTHRVLFSSDLHGNEGQYSLLEGFADKVKPDSLILGGDLTPKNLGRDALIEGQREWIRGRFLPYIQGVKRRHPKTNIFVIMGNDDVAVNEDLFTTKPKVFHLIHGVRARINGDFDIVGEPFVPLTHVKLKDWDKFDMPAEQVPPEYMEGHVRRMQEQEFMFGSPVRSQRKRKGGFFFSREFCSELVPFSYDEIRARGYISDDLARPEFTTDPGKTVYVMHAPPYGTNLDQKRPGMHVGSIAERLFIENQSPYVTLHGHIHSTVENSGDFRQRIGRTRSFSSGNSPKHPYLNLVDFDLYDPASAEYKTITFRNV